MQKKYISNPFEIAATLVNREFKNQDLDNYEVCRTKVLKDLTKAFPNSPSQTLQTLIDDFIRVYLNYQTELEPFNH